MPHQGFFNHRAPLGISDLVRRPFNMCGHSVRSSIREVRNFYVYFVLERIKLLLVYNRLLGAARGGGPEVNPAL
jgi:hypothetical protein